MNRFETLKSGAFMPFTLMGWPDVDASFNIIKAMIDGGASALELGVPFSDPVADGPVIQAATFEALESGMTVHKLWALLKQVRAYHAEIPISLMVYYNMVLAQGVERFFQEAKASGVDGILIVDLPPELADEVAEISRTTGVALIFILSPLTSPERLSLILQYASGYLYVVSRLGITGTEERYDADLQQLIQSVKSKTSLPLLVGFGISTPAQTQKMLDFGADGVITGSHLIKLVQRTSEAKRAEAIRAYVSEMTVRKVSC